MVQRRAHNIELRQLASSELLAQAAVTFWRSVQEPLRGTQRMTVALSGGRIAKHFFRAAATQFASLTDGLAQTHFFWADERCVPPTHPESNYRLAKEHLLEPLKVPEVNIHRIQGEMDPIESAALAERELRQLTNPCSPDIPVLDLVFLGMGEDGHIASLFPGMVQTESQRAAVYIPVTGPKPPFQRISLTEIGLQRARQVCVLASGEGKAEALKDALSAAGKTPLASLLRSRTHTLILTDIQEH